MKARFKDERHEEDMFRDMIITTRVFLKIVDKKRLVVIVKFVT